MTAQGALIVQVSYSLVWIFRILFITRRLWNQPLRQGPAYFLGVAVGPEFGPEGRALWLRRYRYAILAPTLAELALALWATANGYWNWYPLLAGFGAVAFTASTVGVNLWWRRLHPSPTPRRVAVSLESRNLARYTGWRSEGLMAVLLVASWVALLHSSAPLRWKAPVAFTYVVVGLAAARTSVVRSGWAVPADQAESYHHLVEAYRRNALRTLDTMRWMFTAILAGLATIRLWPGPGTRWAVAACALALWLWLMALIWRSGAAQERAESGLRPLSSFVPATWSQPRHWIPPALWLGGLLAIVLWPSA